MILICHKNICQYVGQLLFLCTKYFYKYVSTTLRLGCGGDGAAWWWVASLLDLVIIWAIYAAIMFHLHKH